MSPSLSLEAISFSAEAISSACARDSSAQGPAIRASGRPLPKRAAPMVTIELGTGVTASFMGRTMRLPCPGVNRLPWGRRKAADFGADLTSCRTTVGS